MSTENEREATDAALASVMRKLLADDCVYVYLEGADAVCIDGWVENLTSDEMDAMRRVADWENT